MLYFIGILLVIVNLYFSRSRQYGKYFMFLGFAYLWIIHGWSSGAYDVEIAINRYVDQFHYQSFTEPLFNLAITLGHKANMSYRVFYAVVSGIELFFIYRFVTKYSQYGGIAVALFIIYPMAYAFTVVRYFMAYTFVLCGAVDALLDKKRFYEIRFLAYVAIGACFHYSVAFFVLYLVADKLSFKKTLIFSVITSFVLANGKTFLTLIAWFAKNINADKINSVINNARGYGLTGRSILMVVIALEFTLVYYLTHNKFQENQYWNKEKNELVMKFNLINIISIILTDYYGIGFIRIFVVGKFLYYIVYSNVLGGMNPKRIPVSKFIAVCVILISMIAELILVYRHESFRELSLYPMFENNELFPEWLIKVFS